jgi:putative ABC transport system permease protein
MPLILTLASRNLFHDRLRFVATVVGIVFSILLVTIQMGLYLGFGRMVTTMIDHANADLWVMPLSTRCFEDPILMDDRQRFRAMALNGVADVAPLVIGFAEWRMPNGGRSPVFIIGTDVRAGSLVPWDIVAGDVAKLETPGAVTADETYLDRLGVSGLGSYAEIRDHEVQIVALTRGIRSFTTTPYIFVPIERARTYTGASASRTAYFLVRLKPGTDLEAIRREIRANLLDVQVLTPDEFRAKSRSFWLFGTGAGAALFAGALLGVIVGTVIVAQTLYASTKDHLNEFAILRAIGSPSKYIYKVIIWQAILNALIGFGIASVVSLVIAKESTNSALPVVLTPELMGALFMLTIAMCVVSAMGAIVKVTRIDPATAFTR